MPDGYDTRITARGRPRSPAGRIQRIGLAARFTAIPLCS